MIKTKIKELIKIKDSVSRGDLQGMYKDYDNLWIVNYGRGMEKILKTKAQAMKFAIQYMKSHPNGRLSLTSRRIILGLANTSQK